MPREKRWVDLLEADGGGGHVAVQEKRASDMLFNLGSAACMRPHTLLRDAQLLNGASLCLAPLFALALAAMSPTSVWVLRVPVQFISASSLLSVIAKMGTLVILLSEHRLHHLPFGPMEQYR